MYDISAVSSTVIVGSCWIKFYWFVERKFALFHGLFYDAISNWDKTISRLGWPVNNEIGRFARKQS